LIVDPSTVKITDFGLSKVMNGSLMKTVCGTLLYLAPEVLIRSPAGISEAQRLNFTLTSQKNPDGMSDHSPPIQDAYNNAVDAWSLGVILFVMLSLTMPFREQTLMEDVFGSRIDFSSAIWNKRSELSKDLIRKMLTVDPSKRYTLEQTLNHPWMTQAPSVPNYKLNIRAPVKDVVLKAEMMLEQQQAQKSRQ